jgi:hypothetical protein
VEHCRIILHFKFVVTASSVLKDRMEHVVEQRHIVLHLKFVVTAPLILEDGIQHAVDQDRIILHLRGVVMDICAKCPKSSKVFL